MRNYSSGYTVQIDSTDKQEHRIRLITQLENCTNHIRSLQERLRSDITKLKPIELERLLDDYRAEQIRYDNLSRELDGHNTAASRRPERKCRVLHQAAGKAGGTHFSPQQIAG